MSAFTSAAHDEDSDTIDQLRTENTRLRQALLTMHGTLEKTARVGAAYVQANETLRDSMIRWAARAEQAEELLEAIGAGGVGSPIKPQAEQPTTEDSSVVQAEHQSDHIPDAGKMVQQAEQASVKDSLTAQAEPVAWPKDAEQVRAFMGTHVGRLRYARDDHKPNDDDTYTLSAHDFLTAIEWWTDAPYTHPQPAQPAISPGWKLVPVEPTTKMVHEIEHASRLGGIWTAASIYQAMLYAAPEAPAQQPLTKQRIDELIEEGVFGCNPYEIVRRLEEERGVFMTRPLTDERAIEAIKAAGKVPVDEEGWIWKQRLKWVRAIERAHGIGGEA